MSEFANDTVLQLTLRQMQQQFKERKFYGFMAVAILILALSGPFGTLEHYNALERLAYWAIIAPTTYILASGVATLVTISLMRKKLNSWLAYIAGGTSAGIVVGIFVWLFGVFLDQSFGRSFMGLLTAMTYTIPITIGVTLLFKLSEKPLEEAESNSPDIRFFERIPKDMGRDLISLNSQDHYVKVTTSMGSELILMRLSDAIIELEGFAGLQPHRSWWIAKEHVKQIKTLNGKKVIELSNSDLVPISRSKIKDVSNYLSNE
ncbi:MAG: LytTR family transcriptional regulator [Rhizobiaceae bacterium]|nr:LytTR family transcriptional regulator [Rhizobiaceae bacterium]